ncbi:hypothetical protein [Paenibacillus sp. LK1]|uniref:hypothetical protein n=1 Tax=Paenibacillus sp. LK1 TaxID=2053014 RepID=UPI000C1A6763|nr:hypothetical protein [Paenibacillus sp. LK1]PIH59075.1 hypothetical protein CS562_14120 [Paenibacillus sp. LK1]
MLTLAGILDLLTNGNVAKAEYGLHEEWYITRRFGDSAIVYCNQDGEHLNEVVPLTESNLEAWYTIL